jgi:hypothetical protein
LGRYGAEIAEAIADEIGREVIPGIGMALE